MIAALAANLSPYWEKQLRGYLSNEAMLLVPQPDDLFGFVRAVQVSLVVFGMEALTEQGIEQYRQLKQEVPGAVFVCLAPTRVIEQIRSESLLAADFWLRPEHGPADLAEVLRQALAQASLTTRAEQTSGPRPVEPATTPPPRHEELGPASRAFERLIGGLTGGFDRERLLRTYLDAVVEMARCGSYCLLWWDSDSNCYTVEQAHGVRPELVTAGRLVASSAVPTWYRRNRRLLIREELTSWSDVQTAGEITREMDLFGGQVIVPFMMRGQLSGLLMLGERVTGGAYSPAQLETLFLLSNYVALALEDFELHQQLHQSKAYIERILLDMGTGVITLGPDGRISVCNPYAASVLEMDPAQLEGADLRALPSPLGDYLYAVLKVPEEAIRGQETTIWNGKLTLRVTTSALVDDDGASIGAVLLMEDLTAEVSLAEERHRRERLKILTGIVGRLVHEIRTPLTAIRTYAELMGGPGGDGDLAEFWKNTVTPEIQRLDQLARDLVRVVQQPEPDFELTRIDQVVDEAIGKLRETCSVHDSLIKLQVGEGLPRVVVDPEVTRDAVFYLLRHLYGTGGQPVHVDINAVKTDLGDSVLVRLWRSVDSSDELPSKDLFDPVVALQSECADLGPAISRKIIENQQGRVVAHCDNSRLEIRVTLPAAAIHRTASQ